VPQESACAAACATTPTGGSACAAAACQAGHYKLHGGAQPD